MKFEIKNWLNGKVMFTLAGENWKVAFSAAVKAGQKFEYADLSGKDFSGVKIDGGRFDNSRFVSSSFYNSRFVSSRFDNSRFVSSRFDNSRFDNSRFDNSRFVSSRFVSSRFDNSRFDNSRFDNSSFVSSRFDSESFKNIPQQWFIECRDDLWAILLAVPSEVKFLRQALVDGKVDGSTYSGTCACLVGTLANGRKCTINDLGIVKPNSNRPAERYFLAIRPGGTPDKNSFAKKAVEWVDEFVALQVAAAKVFGK